MESWPEIVIMVTAWCGPPERNAGAFRLEYMDRMITGMRKHLKYPSYSWHIADDNSNIEHQEKMLSKFPVGTTFSSTETIGGDWGHNLNGGLRAAYKRSDIVLLWHDDRWLTNDLDLEPCVRLLMENEKFGLVRLKPRNPNLIAEHYQQYGIRWWLLSRKSSAYVVGGGPHLIHKRFTDHYGLYPTGLAPDKLEAQFNSKFVEMGGIDILCPNAIWETDEMPWGVHSTWEY